MTLIDNPFFRDKVVSFIQLSGNALNGFFLSLASWLRLGCSQWFIRADRLFVVISFSYNVLHSSERSFSAYRQTPQFQHPVALWQLGLEGLRCYLVTSSFVHCASICFRVCVRTSVGVSRMLVVVFICLVPPPYNAPMPLCVVLRRPSTSHCLCTYRQRRARCLIPEVSDDATMSEMLYKLNRFAY